VSHLFCWIPYGIGLEGEGARDRWIVFRILRFMLRLAYVGVSSFYAFIASMLVLGKTLPYFSLSWFEGSGAIVFLCLFVPLSIVFYRLVCRAMIWISSRR